MSVKDCGHHHHEDRRKVLIRVLLAAGAFVFVVAVTVLLTLAILHPTKPTFVLQDVTVYNFTPSAAQPCVITAVVQVTISSRNPNDRIGIYYRRLDAFITYRGQQITEAKLLPEGYQGHCEVTMWSPILCGSNVPVSPYLQAAMAQDLSVGCMLVDVKVSGRVKWKVGWWVSGQYQLDVNCPAYFRFAGAPVGPVMTMHLVQRCHVETALG